MSLRNPDGIADDLSRGRPRRWHHRRPGGWLLRGWLFGWLGRRLNPWHALLGVLGGRLARGTLVVETPAGERLEFAAGPEPCATLTLHRWRAVRRLIFGGDIAFGEAFVDGDWSSPDPVRLLELALANDEHVVAPMHGVAPMRLVNRLYHRRHRNTRRGSRRNIARHYDLGNEFYALWLDPGMTYSSGLYATGEETLVAAQDAKYRRVVELLALDDRADRAAPPRVLEIGCGWGGLAELLARGHGCRTTGLTLSRAQLAFARARIADAGLGDRAELRLEDYRDVTGRFDRVASIEMLEAVGEEHWPRYFDVLRERLVDGGVAVLQVITIADQRFEDYRQTPDFIQRHIFPGGMLPSPRAMRREIARAGLVLDSVETFGDSYARTLAEWRRRFRDCDSALAAQAITPAFRRTWEYYLAYCEAGFRAGAIDVGLYRLVKPR